MLSDPTPRSITWRSLLLGTVAAMLICALTPYNSYVLSDTSLTAGFLPLAAVIAEFVLVVLINAPLYRFAPKHALGHGELGVILLMVLVACAIPDWGLMRFLVPTPVSPFHAGTTDETFWKAFTGLNPPHWLYPVQSMAGGRGESVVTWFFSSRPAGEAIPWHAWLMPAFAWGIFVVAMLTTLTCIARMVIEQWAANERLPFPLVQVQLALIEPPKPGFVLNDLFRNSLLWIGLLGVLGIHSLNALALYSPTHFPSIPLGYDFAGFITQKPTTGEPLSFLDLKMQKATLSFIVIGVTYFIRSKVALSLWGCFAMVNLVMVVYGTTGGIELPTPAWQDEHLGACVAFIGGIIWIGRQHWLRIIRNSFGFGSSQYRLSFWLAIIGIVVMIGWLCVVGVHVYVALAIVAFILAAQFVTARVLAETGIPFYRSTISLQQFYTNLPKSLFAVKDIYFAGVFNTLGPLTTRDGLLPLTLSGLNATRDANVSARDTKKLGGIIAWTLLVSCLVAAPMTLWCQYSYPTPLDLNTTPQRNFFGAQFIAQRDLLPPVNQFSQKPPQYPAKQQNSYLHIGIGFVVTAILEVASLRYVNWPILPVGYVAAYGSFIGNAWFSIFIGWLLKVLIVRFGGASLFQKMRPFFVGILFGEAFAAGLWLLINAAVVFSGGEIKAVKILL